MDYMHGAYLNSHPEAKKTNQKKQNKNTKVGQGGKK